jgi:DNA-binding CsgD family transcriptional regulator
MEAYQLADQAGPSTTMPGLTRLIDVVGEDTFAPSLFTSVLGWIKPDHLTAFAFIGDTEPRIILAENIGRHRVAQDIASHYRKAYWRHDLANSITLSLEGRRFDGSWAVRTTASEIEYANYRTHCYTSVGLADRISLSETRNGQTVRINFYRCRENAFSSDDANRIFDSAKLLLALVRRHDQAASGSTPAFSDQYRMRLARIAPSLSARELDVCVCIVNGITSEGIALALNVSINTVFTYRKRAYARLGISSQNELVKLVLSRNAAVGCCSHNGRNAASNHAWPS